MKRMIARGQERGFLTSEAITAALEEADLSGEQAQELFSHLEEQGIEVLDADDPGAGSRARSDASEHDPIDHRDPLAHAAEDRALAGAEGAHEDEEGTRAEGLRTRFEDLKRSEVDLTVEPSLDSLRLYLR